jgi:TetR/AcrR family transcriptional regulator of autoinduction and epiphytic fitness
LPKAGDRREDGRALRSRRTADAVALAMLDLIEAGTLQPTAAAVAEKAGVSERAVYRHFRDMEGLFHEVCELQVRRVTRDSLEERCRGFVLRWTTLHERVTPLRRAALLHEQTSAEVRRRHDMTRALQRGEAAEVFAGELAAVAALRRRQTLAALCAAGSWNSWDYLRRYEKLSVEAARSATLATVGSLLGLPDLY